jgi:hypothetical protein
VWKQQGMLLQAWEEHCTMVVMIANIFGKDPKDFETFKPVED